MAHKYPIIKISRREKTFSKLLREIPDCPKELYCRGETKLLNEKNVVAIVGSRRPSEYGLKQTRRIASDLAAQGIVVVSGMAIGIDAAAHRGALDGEGKTIAVLGTAIDKLYPATNFRLAQDILANGGLIVSEYPAGYPFYRANFPLRNRIIAGLSSAVAVTEAAERSGSLITAFLSVDYNREVFALPGNVDRILSRGTNYLIKKGACLLTSSEDILKFYNLWAKTGRNQKAVQLSLEEAKIINILSSGGYEFDTLAKLTALGASELNSALVILEMKKMIKCISGQYNLEGE